MAAGDADPGSTGSTNEVRRRPSQMMTLRDLGIMVELPFLAIVAWLCPAPAWSVYARARARLDGLLYPRGPRELAAKSRLVRDLAAPWTNGRRIFTAYRAASHENRIQALRVRRPDRWNPDLTVTGTEHIDAGLDAGHGVVLWVADFSFHKLVLKLALRRAGYDVSHLSGPRHGWSPSRFGVRFLNWLQIGAETRFLAERVVMSDLALPTARRVLGAMRILRRRLGENRVVSVSALTSDWGPEFADLSNGRIRLAAGPPSLAFQTGAPLLPVFAVREPDGAYRVIIGPPLAMDRAENRRTGIRTAVEAYTALLESFVRRYPDQWMGWTYIQPGQFRT